jgi:serine/threonine protein kinase
MGNCCSFLFEKVIRSLDKYDLENATSEKVPFVDGLSLDSCKRYDSIGQYHSLPLTEIIEPCNVEAVIDDTSKKIRSFVFKKCLMNNAASSTMLTMPLKRSLSKKTQQQKPGRSSNDGRELPVELSKLYSIGPLIGIGTTAKVYQIQPKRRSRSINIKNKSANNGSLRSDAGLFPPEVAGKETAVVDVAEDQDKDETFLACKIIDKRKLTSQMKYNDVESLLSQLRREVDILRRTSHPNIVRYVDFMESKSQMFIITEYLKGGELFDCLSNFGSLPEPMVKYLMYDIFDAVAYLHDRSIIHRDIKSENCIFFINEFNELALKLIDFGFSINIKANHMTTSFLGTFGYIAPEIMSNRYYNTSVDNWALGILLFVTLSKRLPFKHPTVSPESVTDIIINDPSVIALKNPSPYYYLHFPEKTWKGISNECKNLIQQLLQIDPMKRITAKAALHHPWVSSCSLYFVLLC